MGLSIHYSGRIKNAASLPSLVEEVIDISKVHNWEYHLYETKFPDNALNSQLFFSPVYGISFTPPESETISLTFLSNGIMACPTRIHFFANSKSEVERSYIFTNSVKTQYAGAVIHQLIIHILQYLNDKYFEDFQLKDESLYWDTKDENIMREKFKEYDQLIDNFSLSVQSLPIKAGESLQSYFDRVMAHINNLKKR
jgi:hypothetical protein